MAPLAKLDRDTVLVPLEDMAESFDNVPLSDAQQVLVLADMPNLRRSERSDLSYVERHGAVLQISARAISGWMAPA